jgi:malate dehydrogenase (oxaloacetate-decarboxylating)(NADP+)
MARREDALEYHRRGRRGKLEVVPTKPLVSQIDLSLAYTPGVAEPCLEIAKDADASWEYTARGNLVAVITNGTAVLGLGNIGPEAGKPVMEGKACLFKKFADIDVFDLEIRETDVDRFVDIVAALEPSFGGINLEDIAAPACFEIEEKLRTRLRIPVFHDDQHGTAIITGAGLINAARLAGKALDRLRLVVSGAGAAAVACVDFFVTLGMRREHVVLVDSRGVVHSGRADLNRYKQRYAIPDDGRRSLADALAGADMFMGLSVGGLVTGEMVARMADRPIVFALANPDPEIGYPEARAARPDAIVATGRSDYPNQVNNVLGFPFVFRGALDVRATSISEEMKVAAARALADLAHEPVPESVIRAYGGQSICFGRDYLIPKPFDPRVLWWVAPAVAEAAMASGVARLTFDVGEYRERLMSRSSNAAYSIMRSIAKAAVRDARRIAYPEAANPTVLRAVQQVVDEELARPVLLGRRADIEQLCEEMGLAILDQVEIIDPRSDERAARYAERLWQLRQRKGVTRGLAQSLITKSNYFGTVMLELGEVDGLVSGLKLTFPETLRPALEILGLAPGARVAAGMYMMVLQNSVKFFGDATINVDPDAETLADIAVQMADTVGALGVTPRVAMISFSNFGSVKHPDARKVQDALRMVRERRPDLEIDGEMQPDVALDEAKRRTRYPFSALARNANVLVFSSLAAGNAAYQTLKTLGGASAVGPLLLGIARPVALLQNDGTVEDIVNMTAYTVMRAQQQEKARSGARRA